MIKHPRALAIAAVTAIAMSAGAVAAIDADFGDRVALASADGPGRVALTPRASLPTRPPTQVSGSAMMSGGVTHAPLAAVSSVLRRLKAGVLPTTVSDRKLLGKAMSGMSTRASTRADSAPPSTAQCRERDGVPCFSVRQLARAYGVTGAHRAGWTGKGTTVVLPIWWGSPTLRHDLQLFSKTYGLAAPQLEVREFGRIPPMPGPDDPTAPDRYVVAEELTLDASMIHWVAPDARIVVLAGDFGGADGGLKQITAAMLAYAKAHPGVIFSQSYGAFESGFDAQTLDALEGDLAEISGTGATMVVANGDFGATDGQRLAVPYPGSSPHVVGMGGTGVHLDDAGNRTSPDTVWADTHGVGFASGGGLSEVFPRPSFQDRVSRLVGDHRGTSDFALNGDVDSRVIFYSTFNVLGGGIDNAGGWRLGAGTSEAAPLGAGIFALARQAAGRPLGDINPALSRLAADPVRRAASGIADVTKGCNTLADIGGYCARPGWDIPSGNGTVGNAVLFVPALAVASLTRH